MKALFKWIGITLLVLIATLALVSYWMSRHRIEVAFAGVHRFLPAKEVKAYQDVRWWNLWRVDFRDRKELLASLDFNRKTRWPPRRHLPADLQPDMLLTNGMNPGLGVRELHRQGITGKGVRVAIIDQPLPGRHPEYVGKLLAYRDFGSEDPTSMHGPAVTSLLVGTRCGTAPEARVYFAACPLSEYAQALSWILEENAKLAQGEKIRVVSVSAAPSGRGS